MHCYCGALIYGSAIALCRCPDLNLSFRRPSLTASAFDYGRSFLDRCPVGVVIVVMSKAKFAEPILETIDQLRSRKARPDLARICHMVERRHGLGADDVRTNLAIMVDENLVIKVNYKGNISYRNPAKKRRRRRDLKEERRPAAVMRAKLPKKKLLNLKAAKALVKTKRKRGRPPLNKTKIKQVVKVDAIEEAMDESAVENAPEDVKDVASRSAETSSHKKAKDDSESITDLSADETASSRSSKAYTGRQKVRIKYELVKGRKSSGKAGSDIHGSVKVRGAESDHAASETESSNVAASNDVEDTNSASAGSLVDSKKIKLIMSKKKVSGIHVHCIDVMLKQICKFVFQCSFL